MDRTGFDKYNRVRDPRDSVPDNAHKPQASWNEAETPLKDAEADVLMILDTCSAGNIFKGQGDEGIRAFQVLAAAGRNQPASPPGKNSFTRALIDALKAQLARSDHGAFNAFDLHNDIMRRRQKMNSQIFRHPFTKSSSRFIKLAPLAEKNDMNESISRRETAYLTLRLAFGEASNITPEAIEALAKGVSHGVLESKLDIRAIDWLGLKPSASTRWHKSVHRITLLTARRRKRSHEEHEEEPKKIRSPKKAAPTIRTALGALSPSPSVQSQIDSP